MTRDPANAWRRCPRIFLVGVGMLANQACSSDAGNGSDAERQPPDQASVPAGTASPSPSGASGSPGPVASDTSERTPVAAFDGATIPGGDEEASSEPVPALPCPPPPSPSESFEVDERGVTFHLEGGLMRLEICQDDIVRVEYAAGPALPEKASLSVSNPWPTPSFCVSADAGVLTVVTARMKAKVELATGLVSYSDLDDNLVLSEAGKSVSAATVEGVDTYRVQTIFDSPAGEGLFGLGQHQDGVINRKGTNRRLVNANTQINVPLLVSSRGYGIFWDNYSASDFFGDEANGTQYRYVSEAGEMVDYYFFFGPSIDQVVAGYRTATGAAPLFPKWAYGLFQSKDKYASQAELLAVKDAYRSAGIPLDAIVQDWDYWTPNTWGSHLMDQARYPDPEALLRELHDDHIHGMISVWPLYEFSGAPRQVNDQDNYRALDALGALLESSGTHHFYDPFNAEARALVYQQIHERLLGRYGWDGIWADNTEPQSYPDGVNVRAADTALGKGALYVNAYPLEHSRALYEGWRSIGPDAKRVYVLNRSAFAGQQRYATTSWSGDIDSDFPTFARQVPAGLSFAAAGMPYWTTDIGGYWGHQVNWSTAANNELFTRWFQYGAFSPIFRIHGGGARELYGNQWSAATKANLLSVDELRYRLMPYVYSLAWRVTRDGYTIMRPLVFDFREDPNGFDVDDQFMFGPAFLVNPVTAAGVTSRSVYFPAGTWYDFWTGATVPGGNRATVPAPLSQMPLFVRAGSVVPMGPLVQYATESIDPLEIRIYAGRDGSFTLYEDAGDSYAYERGEHSEIELTWQDSTRQLTIGARSGRYPGMLEARTFHLVWVGADHGVGVATGVGDRSVEYDGSEVVVRAP